MANRSGSLRKNSDNLTEFAIEFLNDFRVEHSSGTPWLSYSSKVSLWRSTRVCCRADWSKPVRNTSVSFRTRLQQLLRFEVARVRQTIQHHKSTSSPLPSSLSAEIKRTLPRHLHLEDKRVESPSLTGLSLFGDARLFLGFKPVTSQLAPWIAVDRQSGVLSRFLSSAGSFCFSSDMNGSGFFSGGWKVAPPVSRLMLVTRAGCRRRWHWFRSGLATAPLPLRRHACSRWNKATCCNRYFVVAELFGLSFPVQHDRNANRLLGRVLPVIRRLVPLRRRSQHHRRRDVHEVLWGRYESGLSSMRTAYPVGLGGEHQSTVIGSHARLDLLLDSDMQADRSAGTVCWRNRRQLLCQTRTT